MAKSKSTNTRATSEVAATLSNISIVETLEERFKEDDRVNKVLQERRAQRAQESAPINTLAEAAFANFKPSRLTAADRQSRNFLRNREELTEVLETVANKGAEELRVGADHRALTLQVKNTESLVDKPNVDGIRAVSVPALINLLLQKLVTPPTLRNDPAVTICKAKDAAEKALQAIEGTGSQPTLTPSQVATSAPHEEPNNSKDFVSKHVHTVMHTASSPEERLQVNIERRATQDDVAQDTFKFQLRDGASDVTSYHDFNSLQIAFEHVWEEILDDRLGESGRQLYFAYNQVLKDHGLSDPNRPPVTSVADLKKLLADIRTFLGTTVKESPPPNSSVLESLFTWLGHTFDLFARDIKLDNLPDVVEIVGAHVVSSRAIADRFKSQLSPSATTGNNATDVPNVIDGATRLSNLLYQIDKLLSAEYSFTVFAPKAVNFGVMVTYRQTWKPESYQVGDLVSTIPLAPREVRRYTTKRISKKTRAAKELEDNLRTTKTEADSTSRAEREIVARAENKTNFNMTAHESYGSDGFNLSATQQGGGDQAQLSADTKKQFREAVLKSAQEYRQQNRMEIDSTSTEETEETTFHEIQNPNDELTVTYLFYELQRTYRISEKIHRVTPVVLVANEVPKPNEIDDAWLIKYDWILRRVILDDSFRPALDYLTKSFVGAEINIQILENNAKAQRQLVDEIKGQLKTQLSALDAALRDLSQKADAQTGLQFTEGVLGTVKKVFDPFGLTGNQVLGTASGAQALVDFAQTGVDRAEREKSRLLDQLGIATTALQVAVDKLSAAIKEHYDRVTEIDRLRIHVKENILYYMQAIWNHEPPDQRYFRVFNVKVPVLEPVTGGLMTTATGKTNPFQNVLKNEEVLTVELPRLSAGIEWKPLVEVADIDEVLGYKGNYAIYRLKQNNYLTLHMMQNYLEISDLIQIRDPDEFAEYTVDELQALAECLYRQDKTSFENHREEIKKLIVDRLISGRAEDDRVIVPTNSLYIECLVGTHPLLEDFKLAHRVLDVKKVQAEVRHAELENVRLAARALEGERDDPDIEKKIVIESKNATSVMQPDN
jgi:hypothetical protein